jgi:hypothetical protein
MSQAFYDLGAQWLVMKLWQASSRCQSPRVLSRSRAVPLTTASDGLSGQAQTCQSETVESPVCTVDIGPPT